MRSLIILEVEHGESTDPLDQLIHNARQVGGLTLLDFNVKIDLPECFVLETK